MTGAGPGWSGARVLVTGASGFIGSRLASRLRSVGALVHAVSRRSRSQESEGTVWHQGDVADEGFARAVIEASAPDHVFHLASRVTGSQLLTEVLPTFHANLTSTVNLLVAAAHTGAPRFVTAGSLVAPPEGENRSVPSSPYAAAKWASADYVRMVHALYDLPVSVARIFMVYGAGQRDTSKLVPSAILAALNGESPRCGSGSREADWIHVDDVVDGLLAIGRSPEAVGRTLDLGTGTLTSVRHVVEEIVRRTGSAAPPLFGEREDPRMEPVEVANVEETDRVIGWSAKIVLAKGLSDTVAWYEEHYPKESR